MKRNLWIVLFLCLLHETHAQSASYPCFDQLQQEQSFLQEFDR